jgi:hypothetical protein
MNGRHFIAGVAALTLAGCDNGGQQASTNAAPIKVRGSEQERLHQLSAFDLAIALKHAIYDAGYTCKRVTDGGFVGAYKNLDMWMAHCVYDHGAPRDWAVFAGPDGSAQVRDCRDIPGSGLPECVAKQRPDGSFTDVKTAPPKKPD